MPRGVLTTTCAAALAAMAVVTPSAVAAPGTIPDPDFAGASFEGTEVAAGTARLKRGVLEEFAGPALPAGMTTTQWATGTGGATFSDGQLVVDGARVEDGALAAAPRTLEFRATFGGDAFQNVGFGDTFTDGPWAMFSTGGGTVAPALYARTATGNAGTTADHLIGTVDDAKATHLYRVEWTAAKVDYYVDNALKHTAAAPPAVPLHPVISDFTASETGVTVESMVRDRYPDSGTLVSRVFDSGDPRAAWGKLTSAGGATGVVLATRSGNTATPDASWSDWAPVGAGNAIASPAARYLQYRATFSTPDPLATPTLDGVDIAYDDPAPRAVIDGVDVSGATASVRFSSPDADITRMECSLDGAPFAACSSPKAFSGLAAGAHSVAVRAVDKSSTGGDTSRGFTVASAPPSGGGGGGTIPPPAGGGTTVAKEVAVSLVRRNVRATTGGVVKLQVKCLRGEKRCTVTLRLKRGGKFVASKATRIDAGATRTVSLRLNKRTRSALVSKGSVKLSATLAARDNAGNSKSVTRSLTVKAPR